MFISDKRNDTIVGYLYFTKKNKPNVEVMMKADDDDCDHQQPKV